MENEKKPDDKRNEIIFSQKFRAGKRRTYFFDVKTTRANDYYITLTESKKRMDADGYERHKIFLYKEDFNKFLESLTQTINHVKTDLMPEYDFDEFSHKEEEYQQRKDNNQPTVEPTEPAPPTEEKIEPPKQHSDDEDMKW